MRKASKKTKSKPNNNYKSFGDLDFDEASGNIKQRELPIKSFQLEFKNGVQRLAWNIYQQHNVLFMLGPAGCGKALPLTAKLYNRSGPMIMGDVKVGDEIANPDGGFSKVTGVFPQGKKQVYRVNFNDETHVDCCADHLWKVNCTEFKNKVVDTKYLLDNIDKKFTVKTTKPVEFSEKIYDYSPHWMGMLSSKEFPDTYLYGSVRQRIELLGGLITGSEVKNNYVIFETDSKKISESFCNLVQSLGGIVKTKFDEKFNCHFYLTKDMQALLFNKKIVSNKYYPKRQIISVNKLDYEVEMQCISVDHVDNLYLTDNYTVTHNTHLATAFAIEEILNKQSDKSKIVLTRPVIEAGESLGYLPGPQPLTAKILTPNGWTTMGKIKVGDMVVGRDGKPTKVLKVLPKGKKMVYRVLTTEGTSTECCEDHLWTTKTYENKKRKTQGSIKSTKQIMESLLTKTGKLNHYLPRNEAVEFEKQELPIPAYTLGGLLGDGHLGNSICLCTADKEISDRVNKELKNIGCSLSNNDKTIVFNVKRQDLNGNKPARKIRISNIEDDSFVDFNSVATACATEKITKGILRYRCTNKLILNKIKYEFLPLDNQWSNPVKNIIDNLGLLKTKSYNKFIPDIYKYSSIEDRINLLRGLMDTDGTIKKNGEASFTTTSKKMAKDVIEVVKSLGGRATLRERNRVNKTSEINRRKITVKNISYEFNISLPEDMNPFYLTRKAERFSSKYIHSIGIKSITPVEEKEVQCIVVDNPEHLYITDDFIVTHNSFDEKIDPYMMPLWDCIQKIAGPTKDTNKIRSIINESYEVAPLAYMRGRLAPYSEKVPTPSGMMRHGDLIVGDYVFGSNGKPTKVIGVYPHGVKKIYRVKFSDRTEVRCGAEHLWNTMTLNEKRHNKGYTTKTTEEIAKNVIDKYNRKVHRVPILSGPAEFEKRDIEIDPYLLGCLLGDGHFGKAFGLTSNDPQIVEECAKRLPKNNTLNHCRPYSYRISFGGNNLLIKELERYGLRHKKSYNKFVPDDYKFNTPEVRLEVLQGLLDTDGWICKHRSGKCRVQYCSTSKQLADDVMFLVRSLGGYAYSRLREYDENDFHEYKGHIIKHVHNAYQVDIMIDMNPFKLERKAKQHVNLPTPTKMIVDIIEDGEEESSCIQVEAQDHLYLIDDFIVTHNTFDDSVCLLDEAQNCTRSQLKLFLTRMGSNSKMIITGDPKQSDLGGVPALVDVVCRLESIPGVGVVYFNEECIVRHPIVGEILKRLEK